MAAIQEKVSLTKENAAENSRGRKIIQTSIIGILANVFLAAFKAVIGLTSNSIAIVMDAVNNLSDAASSVITIVGTKLAGRETDQGNWLSIAGGDITIESGKDGMDSNGSISISGGTVRVYAMNSAGDGTVDTNGVTTISGGVLVMASTGGGARSTSISGWIPVQLYSGPAVEAGTTFTLEDENGRILVEFTPQSSYDTVMVAASGLEEGSTCTAMIGSGVVFSGTVTSQMTQANGAFGAGFGQGGPGQNGRNRKGW